MKKSIILSVFTLIAFQVKSQIGIGTSSPSSSAALEIKDTTRGLLIPRMKIKNRNEIPSPPEGLIIYQTDSSKGYWYFDGTQWKNVNNTGKQILILSDTISNAQAQTKINEDYGSSTQIIKILGCSNLTTIDLSMVSSIAEIVISDNAVLQSVNLSNLTKCDGSLKITNCPALTSVNLNSLEKIIAGNSVDALTIQNTKLGSLSFTKLKKIFGSLIIKENAVMTSFSLSQLSEGSIYRLEISGNNLLSTVSFPLLSRIATDLSVNNNPVLSSLTFQSLQNLGWIDINNNTGILNVSFPSLTGILSSQSNSSTISQCQNMTSVDLGNLSILNNSALFIIDNKLPSSKINQILAKLVSITPNITNKTISLGQIIAAPPTGQGLVDKSTLISRGNTVLTD